MTFLQLKNNTNNPFERLYYEMLSRFHKSDYNIALGDMSDDLAGIIHECTEYLKDKRKTMDKLNYTLETAPRDANGWISIDDLLPELDENVIILKNDNSVFVGNLCLVSIRKSSRQLEWEVYRYNECTETDTVSHWQPLPKPLNKQTNESTIS